MEQLFTRQTGIIAPEKLRMPILLVGAGSIGSWTALALAKLGCTNLTVMDHDTVEEHNAGSQLYRAMHAGETKVVALENTLRLLADVPVATIAAAWQPDAAPTQPHIIISAVDSITVRRQLFETYRGQEKLFIDGRMAGNALEIYTVYLHDEASCAAYESTLFGEEDALPVPCSERSVVYNVFVCAGLIGALIAKHANGELLPPETLMDLKNVTLFT